MRHLAERMRQFWEKRMMADLIALCLTLLIFSVALAADTWNCPECGRTGNTGKYCGECGHASPYIENKANDSVHDSDKTADETKKETIKLPYGIRAGMTIEEVDRCMRNAGFKMNNTANNGQTIYYGDSIVQGAVSYSSLISVFSDGVTHVIHFFLEDDQYSKKNPSPDYLRIESMLKNLYGDVSYSIPDGSNGWKNDSIEIHFGYLTSSDQLYYALAYWYLPENIAYPGF